jgi:hypothetical protein
MNPAPASRVSFRSAARQRVTRAVLLGLCLGGLLAVGPAWAQPAPPSSEPPASVPDVPPASEPPASAPEVAPAAAPPASAPEIAPLGGGAELRSVAMKAGQIEVTVPLVINMSRNLVANPMGIPFDVYRGFTDDWTLGLTHSRGTIQGVGPYGMFRHGNPEAAPNSDYARGSVRGIGPFDLNQGLCVSNCPRAYSNFGFDGLYRMVGGPIQIAAHGGVDISWYSDSDLSVRLGLLGKAALGTDVALLIDPRFGVALHNGPHTLDFPLAVQFMTDAGVRWGVQAGIAGSLGQFANTYDGWLGGFGSVGVNEKIEAFAAFIMTNLVGVDHGFDGRALTLGLNIRPF